MNHGVTAAALITLAGGLTVLLLGDDGVVTTLGLALLVPGVALSTMALLTARRERVIDLRDDTGPNPTSPVDDAVSPGRSRPAPR